MMFPSTNYSSSPYPCFLPSSSSSSYHPFTFPNLENASSSASNNNNTTFLLHDPFAVLPYNAPLIPETLTNLAVADAAMFKQDHHNYNNAISNFLTKKKKRAAPAKKDRHSKISTSQGLRDRRVRLSIEIARKFFDLQDMLGFDKASNTLEWLFTKSNKAIKELASSSNNNGFSSSEECDEEEEEEVDYDSSNDAVKERKMKRAQKLEEQPAASNCGVRAKMKESREKARARARERISSNKVVVVQDHDHLKQNCPPATKNPQILNQLVQPQPQPHLMGIEESIVIKRKLKPSNLMSSSHHHHHHQNLVIPKELPTFNSGHDYHSFSFPNLPPDRDTNGATNLCAIATMNLSTELQVFGKSWEECTNPRLH